MLHQLDLGLPGSQLESRGPWRSAVLILFAEPEKQGLPSVALLKRLEAEFRLSLQLDDPSAQWVDFVT